MSNSNLYYEAQSWSVKNGGKGLKAKNGGRGIKIEEWRVKVQKGRMNGYVFLFSPPN